jgi:hypothetical protein
LKNAAERRGLSGPRGSWGSWATGHGPDNNDPFNVPQNFQFQGAVVPPLIHVVNLRELDPPIFRGLLHEDVMEWTYQFQRVSEFNHWGPWLSLAFPWRVKLLSFLQQKNRRVYRY